MNSFPHSPQTSRRARHTPGDAVVPLLGLCALALIARITVFLRQRSATDFDSVDVTAGAEIGIVFLTAITLALGATRVRVFWHHAAGKSVRPWLAYYAFGAVTAIQAINPAFSLFRAVEALSQALAVGVVIDGCARFRQAERVALLLAWCTLLLEAFGRFKLGGFSAVDLSSNSFSATAAMLTCYSFGEALEARGKRRMGLFAGAAVAGAFVVVGLSLASWWAALAGLLLAGIVLRPSPGFAVALLLMGLVALGWGQNLVEHVILRNRPMTEVSTLHGRMLLWGYYWESFCERPWLGYGFAIGARLKGIAYTTHTHNAILSALLGVGIPGVALLLGSVWRYGREVVRSRAWGTPGWVGCTAALTCGGLNSMSIAFLGEGWMPATLVFTAFFMLHTLQVVRPPVRRPTAPPATGA